MIIGLTGKNASGKGEVANFFQSKGFVFHSLSDVLREELRVRRKSVSRDHLTELGNELRNNFGASVLADRILNILEKDTNYVIDSFRNPDEVKAFRARSDFALLSIDASAKTRFERMHARNREQDARTYKDFLAVEKRELTSSDPAKQNLKACADLADHHIQNDGTIKDLNSKLEKLMEELTAR